MQTVTGSGVYIAQISPEPDSPLTAYWGRAVAWGIRRLLNGGIKIWVKGTSSNPDSFSFGTVNTYSKLPFIKTWAYYGSGATRTYTDFWSLGTAANELVRGRLEFQDKESPSSVDTATFHVEYGASSFLDQIDGFTILAQGR